MFGAMGVRKYSGVRLSQESVVVRRGLVFRCRQTFTWNILSSFIGQRTGAQLYLGTTLNVLFTRLGTVLTCGDDGDGPSSFF